MFSVQTRGDRLHRTAYDEQARAFVAQDTPMSPKYTIVDAPALARRIMDQDPSAKVTISSIVDARKHQPAPFKRVLTVCWPPSTVGYYPTVSILLTHDGRSSVKAIAGALRIACENQFLGRILWYISHVSEEIHDFIADPLRFILEGTKRAEETINRIESVKGVRGGDEFLNAVALRAPRVAGRLARSIRDYQHGALTLWDVLQGLTGAHSPGCQRLADRIMLEGWEAFRANEVPDFVYSI